MASDSLDETWGPHFNMRIIFRGSNLHRNQLGTHAGHIQIEGGWQGGKLHSFWVT